MSFVGVTQTDDRCLGVDIPVSGCSDPISGLFDTSSPSAHVAGDHESSWWAIELSGGSAEVEGPREQGKAILEACGWLMASCIISPKNSLST